MNNLPSGWADAPLASLTTPSRSRENPSDSLNLSYIGLEHIEPHSRKLIGTAQASSIRSSSFHFFPDDVLYGRLRPYLNKVYCAKIEGLCSAEFIVLPPSPALVPEYLTFFLNTRDFTAYANSLNQGDRPRVSFDQLADYQVLIPPLAEQRRIVAKLEVLLSKLDACQQRLERIPSILKRFRQSVLFAALAGRLTENWRSEKSAGADALPAESVEQPAMWSVGLFERFVESSFYGPRFSAEDYTNDGIPTIRTTDIQFDGSILFTDPPRLALTEAEVMKYGLQEGDLLVTRTGATIGKCALYDEALGPVIPSAYLIRFRLKQEIVDPKFILYFLMSPTGQELLLGGSTAVAQPNVNATAISGFPVPLPPLAEQQEIVRRINALLKLADQIEGRYRAAKSHADRLTQSIVAKAFRGELVPTEAEFARRDRRDYESASMLLDRVRREREAVNDGKAPRKPRRAAPKTMATKQQTAAEPTELMAPKPLLDLFDEPHVRKAKP